MVQTVARVGGIVFTSGIKKIDIYRTLQKKGIREYEYVVSLKPRSLVAERMGRNVDSATIMRTQADGCRDVTKVSLQDIKQ